MAIAPKSFCFFIFKPNVSFPVVLNSIETPSQKQEVKYYLKSDKKEVTVYEKANEGAH